MRVNEETQMCFCATNHKNDVCEAESESLFIAEYVSTYEDSAVVNSLSIELKTEM